ncbi:MAG: WD40 repeat domain-containing serine/threonine protein kinase [Phycisphaerales bacterium]
MPTPDQYGRAKTLFLSARRMPRGERTRFLHTHCGDDAALEAKVRRLLTLEEQEPEFLERPAVEPADDRAGVGPGARLGAFRIVRILGEGGMGVVYEAQQDEPARRVALKLIRIGLFSERLRSRFRHEVRILGQLRHPGIAQIYEAGTLDVSGESVPYFAMELVEGRPLLECARALGVRERLALIAQICDAVHHAHQKGVIHRDLKPGNILVESAPTTEGTTDHSGTGTASPFQVKVLDFGVARAIDTDSGSIRATTAHTHAGELIGTLPYMSPEQAAADPAAMDIRSDVYSIGVIAYELLTGRMPCDLEGKPLAEAARAIAEEEPVRLGSIDRALRGDAETIVAKALQKDPRHRYQSAAELAADIRRHLRDEPIAARPASALYQLRKFALRHKPLVAAAALAMLAMAVATAVSTWQARVADAARDFAEGEKNRADRAAAAATREAHRATLAGAAAAIGSGDPITASRLLNGTDESRRDWAWRYWHARLDESVAMIQPGGRIAGEWVSPDGSEVAVVTSDGVIRRGSPWSGPLPEVARLAEPRALLAVFIDQGRRIVTDGPTRRMVTLYDASDGRVIHRHEPLEAPIGSLEASPDGRVVFAAVRRRGRPMGDAVWLLQAPDPGAPPGAAWTGTTALVESGTVGAAIAADGRSLVFGQDRVLAWDTGAPAPGAFANAPRAAQCFAMSGDGARVATGGVDKTVRLWDRAGAPLRTLAGHTGAITALTFDPSGRVLASAAADLTVRLWDAEGGRVLATLIGHTDHINRLQFSADGSVLLSASGDGTLSVLLSASGDGTLRLWRREPFEGARILRDHTSYVYAVAFTPDGSRILSGGWDGMVRVWNASNGRPLGAFSCERGFITALGVAPDGRTFATGQKSDGTGRVSSITLWGGEGWETATPRPLAEIARTEGEISDLIFSADGTRLYAGREGLGLDEFDLTTSPPGNRQLVKGSASGIALSPGGERLACAQVNGSVVIVAVPSGDIARRLEGHTSRVRGVAFHPTRPLLATASDDGTARLWDLNTGTATELRGHADKVYALAFSPDGSLLATGSEDTTIVLWDVDSGDELTRLRGHDAYVYSLAFSPDGSMLVSGSGDHTARVWDTRPVRERSRAGANSGP